MRSLSKCNLAPVLVLLECRSRHLLNRFRARELDEGHVLPILYGVTMSAKVQA